MSAELQRLHDEIGRTFEEVKKHADKAAEETRKSGEAATAETRVALDKVNGELTTLLKNHDELAKEVRRPRLGLETASGQGDPRQHPNPEVRALYTGYEKYLRHGLGEKGRAMLSAEEVRALSSASDAQGGWLVPPEWSNRILMNAYDAAEIRPIATVETTGSDTKYIPKLNKAIVGWGHISTDLTDQVLDAGIERIEVKDIVALVLIHNNTLEDAAADVPSELNTRFSAAVAELEDDAFVTGTGVLDPLGIVTDPRVQARYKPTGVAAALSDSTHNGIDALLSAYYAQKKAYRRNGTWAMNSGVEGAVRILKDANGVYLWQPPVQAGDPPTLLGRPVINPEGLPDVAANAYPIIFGDFRAGYTILDRSGLIVQRLVERYSEKRMTGFQLIKRVGGMVVLPEAFQVVKVAAS